jgi:hypothetical protein
MTKKLSRPKLEERWCEPHKTGQLAGTPETWREVVKNIVIAFLSLSEPVLQALCCREVTTLRKEEQLPKLLL